MTKIQVLIATMHQHDHALLDKMNIQTDAIVGNQCDRNDIEHFEHNGNIIDWFSFAERGVGLNRNNALMRANADICIIADDDMIYVNDYAETVRRAFEECSNADVIVFNLMEPHSQTKRHIIKKIQKVNYTNFMRYGAARLAIRLKSVRENGIYFNQCFGGGTEHCAGEDSLFLASCLDKGLKIYAYPAYIAELTEERPSTWDVGNTKKYLEDKGILFKVMSRKYHWFLCLQDAVRHHKSYGMTISEAISAMTDPK